MATLVLGYVGYYLCRANLDAANPVIRADLDLSKHDMGLIVSWSVAFYAIGKVVHGLLADAIGGRVIFLFGMVSAAFFSAAFGLGTGLVALIVVWSANRFVQAAGWGGMVSVTAQWYPRHRAGGIMAVLSLSYLVGDGLARALAGLIIESGLGWRWAFYLPGALLLAGALAATRTLKASPVAVGEPPLDEEEAGPHPEPGIRLADLKALARMPAFWMLSANSAILTALRIAFLTWTSSYLVYLGSTGGAAAAKSAIFPLAGAGGTLFAGFFSDLASKGRRGPVSVALLLALTAAMVGLASPVAQDPDLALVFIAICGFTLIGPYSLIAGAAAIDLGGRQTAATAAGLFDAIGYVAGAALGGLGMAALADALGWDGAFAALAGLSALSIGPALFLSLFQRPSRAGAR